jgi:glycine oxidase
LATTDVTIRGAGIFGLSIAWACARRGAKVRVIDPAGVGTGASGGIVGALAPHTPERWEVKKQFQFESLHSASSMWAEVAALSGRDPGYARCGRIQPLADEQAVSFAQARAIEAETLWQGHYSWQIKPASDYEGYCPPPATGLVVHDTLSARIHPRKAVEALAVALTKLGVEIVRDGVETGALVIATGVAGLQELSVQFQAEVGNGQKGQAALLAFDGRDLPQLYAEYLHIIPHSDGTTAIGSTSERYYNDPTTTDHLLDDIIARARRICPRLADAPVLERWAGLRPRSRHRAPMLGPHPTRPGVFIANGGFKIGFGMAPKVGDVMADLILAGHDTIPDEFRVEASLPS